MIIWFDKSDDRDVDNHCRDDDDGTLNDTFQINKVTLSETGMGLQASGYFSDFNFLTVQVFDPQALWQLFIFVRHHLRLLGEGVVNTRHHFESNL